MGADLDGTRFCYVAACAGGGYTIPPKTGAEASVSASIAVSGYKDIGTVAGTAGYFALDLGADLPIIPVGIDLGISYVHGVGEPDQIYGISFSGQVSSASSDVNPAPWPSAGVTAGVCHTANLRANRRRAVHQWSEVYPVWRGVFVFIFGVFTG